MTLPKAKSNDIIQTLSPLISQCNNPIKILTDNPSFEFKQIALTSKDIFQTFGLLSKDAFVEKEFMRNSHSKNIKYFINANVIILSKDSAYFDKSKIKNPNDKFFLQSLETLEELESLGFQKFESQYFYIWIRNDCKY